MFESIATYIIRRGWVLALCWLVLAVSLATTAPSWSSVSRDDDVSFFPPDFPSVVGQGLLERGFPDDVASSSAVVVAERTGAKLTDADFAYVDRVATRLEDLARAEPELGLKKVMDYNDLGYGPKLIGTHPDHKGQAVLTLVMLKGTYVSKSARLALERIQGELDELRPEAPDGLQQAMTGSAAVGRDTHNASIKSVDATTYATVILVVVILLIVYRSPLLALIPLATITLSVWTALKGIALLTRVPGVNFQVINITNVFVIVVLFGSGTDYCLFLIARYREELAGGRSLDSALIEAITRVGVALIASAGTVIIGLGMLWFSTFAKISYTGPAIALSLAIALVAALTLAPTLLRWMRGTVFWPFPPPHHVRGADREQESLDEIPMSGFWGKIADLVVRHPLLILSASLLALTPLAVIGARTKASYDLLADLPRDRPSVVGARIIERYFPKGELGLSSILVDHPRINFRSDDAIDAVERVCRDLAALPNLSEVRSVSRPLGDPLATVVKRVDRPATTPPPARNPFAKLLASATLDEVRDRAVLAGSFSRYVSLRADRADRDHITRFDLIFKTNPFSIESQKSLEKAWRIIADSAKPGGSLAGATQIGLTGTTTLVNDLRIVTQNDQRRMYILVTLGVYAILVLLLRRPWICLYLIATVVLGYLASLGITDLVFQSFHRGPEPWVGLDWKVGFFLFVILVAVGEDYNIFLMSRMIEEERKYGPIEGTRQAISHTGGIISSCGLIMAGTFLAMLTGSLLALQELGFALGLGVLLDTFIVRPILVPAFVILWSRLWAKDDLENQDITVPLPVEHATPAPAPQQATGLWAAQRFRDGWH